MDLRFGNNERSNWCVTCEESFGLRPSQLATLVAIVAFDAVEGASMPLTELRRFAGKPESAGMYRVDPDTALLLYRAGLVHRVKIGKSYAVSPSVAGCRRVVA